MRKLMPTILPLSARHEFAEKFIIYDAGTEVFATMTSLRSAKANSLGCGVPASLRVVLLFMTLSWAGKHRLDPSKDIIPLSVSLHSCRRTYVADRHTILLNIPHVCLVYAACQASDQTCNWHGHMHDNECVCDNPHPSPGEKGWTGTYCDIGEIATSRITCAFTMSHFQENRNRSRDRFIQSLIMLHGQNRSDK